MNRRKFIQKTSAGLFAIVLGSKNWNILNEFEKPHFYEFKPYRLGKTIGEIYRVTPDEGFYCNTYHDVIPWSPSQRFLAVTKMPYQDKITTLGDIAEVCVVDLKEQTIQSVYKTKVWGYQLGANLHWGNSDRFLYTNDLIDGKHAVAVQIDLKTQETNALKGPVYDISPDRSKIMSPTLEYMNTTQYAYGTPAPKADESTFMRLPAGAAKDEGVWETDVETNQKTLLVSFSKAADTLEDRSYYEGGTFYFWHTKYNPHGNRVMMVLRCTFPEKEKFDDKGSRNPNLLISNAKGENINVAISRKQWELGANHPTWHPDGEHVIMNLTPEWLGEKEERFCQFKWDGSDLKILSDKFKASGHPTITPDSRYLLSDAYPMDEEFVQENGEVPIRLIDLKQQIEYTVCTIFTDLGRKYDIPRSWGPTKLDCHPVWDRNFEKICFNGAPKGERAVFIADLKSFIK